MINLKRFLSRFTGRSTRNSLGMNECTERNHYFICRPLIETYKNDIKQYQTIHHVPFMKMNLITIINMQEMTFAIDFYQLLMKIRTSM